MEDRQLSEHFKLSEFCDLNLDLTEDIVTKCEVLANRFLESIRAHFNQPVHIDSSYREPRHNAIAGGVPNSFHLFTSDHSAVDFFVENTSTQVVFDWVRLESGLPFDKVIGEFQSPAKHAATDWSGAIVHLQAQATPRRLAYLGSVSNLEGYQQVQVV